MSALKKVLIPLNRVVLLNRFRVLFFRRSLSIVLIPLNRVVLLNVNAYQSLC